MYDGQGETRGQVGKLGPGVRWVSWDQRMGRRAGTRGWVGELGPEGGKASWDQRLGGPAETRGWASREERRVGEPG